MTEIPFQGDWKGWSLFYSIEYAEVYWDNMDWVCIVALEIKHDFWLEFLSALPSDSESH